MPVTITVRDLPPETHAELRRRAAAKGQSLQQFLLDFVIELARRPDPLVIAARLRQQEQAADNPPTDE